VEALLSGDSKPGFSTTRAKLTVLLCVSTRTHASAAISKLPLREQL
jgi:hypothetical protein